MSSSFILYFNDRMPDVLDRLLFFKKEIEKVQGDLGRLLIMSQNPGGYFAESEQDIDGDSMELLILITGDRIKQVSSLNDAACVRFLEQHECRLFGINTRDVTIKEVEIPFIGFEGAKAIEGV